MNFQKAINKDLFSDEAFDIATLAAEIAVRYNHNVIEVEHIFLGLLEQKNGIVSQILEIMKIDVGDIHFVINTKIQGLNSNSKGSNQLSISKRVHRLIDLAGKETFVMRDKILSPEHIFLSIFDEEGNSPSRHILLSQKITKKDVYNAIKNIKEKVATTKNKLKIFLCHSSDDKKSVRLLYEQLRKNNMDPWLDSENLLPGQDWESEIPKAVKNSDVVIVCLSKNSVNKSGYIQKEIKFALNVADEKPEDTIFIIPVKLEECLVPSRLSKWQWLNYFDDNAYSRLINTLRVRASQLGIEY